MIQLPNIIFMFAMFTARTRHTIICDGLFYGHSGTLYPNDIRLSNPHGLLSHDSNLFLPERGEGNLSLFIILCNFSFMARTMGICNAVNNSICTATSAHETCIVDLIGNPYQDIASYGFNLHGCTIRYHVSPNKNGNLVTGIFNISGRIETGGGKTYADLIQYVVNKQFEYRQYVKECHRKKRERYLLSWMSRHPECTDIERIITKK